MDTSWMGTCIFDPTFKTSAQLDMKCDTERGRRVFLACSARREGLVRVRRADALDGVDIVLIDIEHGSNIHGMRYILRTCPHVPLQSV